MLELPNNEEPKIKFKHRCQVLWYYQLSMLGFRVVANLSSNKRNRLRDITEGGDLRLRLAKLESNIAVIHERLRTSDIEVS